MRKLNDICNVITCGVAKRPEYYDDGIPFLSSKNVKSDRFLLNDYKYVSKEDFLSLTKNNKPEKGDILYTRVGSFGEAAVIDFDFDFAIFVSLTLIKPKNDIVLSRYLMHYLNSPKIKHLAKNSTSGVGVQNLNVKVVREFPIQLPPLDQQKKIATILDAADAYRQKTKALIEKYDELTQSLFLDMFGDPVRNPKDWNEVIFTEVLVLRRGFDLPRQDRIKGEYPIMASNGILDWHNEFKVEGPGIVTGRSGTLGKVHYIEGDYWPLNTALYSQKLNGNNPIYLIYLIRNFRVERFSRGAGVPTLNRNLVHAETIMTVPIELQNQFADRVQAIEAQKAQAQG